MIVAAILDRLLHHSVVVNIKGNSYRLKGKLSAMTQADIDKPAEEPRHEEVMSGK